MLKRLATAILGSRHEREHRRLLPIVAEINEHFERLQSLPEGELRAQTGKLRVRIREATAELEAKVAELKAAKHDARDAAEREAIDSELGGSDGRGGYEAELRAATAGVLEEILPEAFATVREACRRLLGTTLTVTGREMTWDLSLIHI